MSLFNRFSTLSSTSGSTYLTDTPKPRNVQRFSFARHRSLLSISEHNESKLTKVFGKSSDTVLIEQDYLESENPFKDPIVKVEPKDASPQPTSLQQIIQGQSKPPFSLKELRDYIQTELEEEERSSEESGGIDAIKNWRDCLDFLEEYFQ
jgi:hypothetical protein